MSKEEMIAILRHKRHDWMNQIQLIQGYASMGKVDKVQVQVDKIIQDSEQERRLLNSSAYEFSLWLLTFNLNQDQYRLTYTIQLDVDLPIFDKKLTAYAKRLLTLMDEFRKKDELYEGRVQMYQRLGTHQLGVSWEWKGAFIAPERLETKLNDEGFIAFYDGDELSVEMTIE
ncbi:Spo0B domain-containing protein [Halobacillus shinanisalinarum]|uniref:Spo0B domain-containing protein n=1 Tax=Halobacillus shinanisalinarum TaxID=2932258 RepID=A0ABY4H0Z9_9BACI|nr:Spo0B domain-containing protein [Halobacillus shinanisalinarum]UOQ93861.1 Spo0B domain-containing protein [Halobacillus shinanisalinarum]